MQADRKLLAVGAGSFVEICDHLAMRGQAARRRPCLRLADTHRRARLGLKPIARGHRRDRLTGDCRGDGDDACDASQRGPPNLTMQVSLCRDNQLALALQTIAVENQ